MVLHVLRQVPIFQPVDMLCARQSQTDFRWDSTRVDGHAVGSSCCARTSVWHARSTSGAVVTVSRAEDPSGGLKEEK